MKVWLLLHRRSHKDGADSMENSPCWRERERERDTESMAQQRDFPIQYIRKWRLLRLHWIHFLCPDTVNSTFYCSSLNPLHMEPWISYVHSSPYKLTSPWPLEQHSHCVFVCLNHMQVWGCLHALVICLGALLSTHARTYTVHAFLYLFLHMLVLSCVSACVRILLRPLECAPSTAVPYEM